MVEAFRRLTKLRSKHRESISLSIGSGTHTVFLDQIILLESNDHSVSISLTDGRRLKVWMSLNELERELDKDFLKINRGIIVNMSHIMQMETETCIMQDGTRLPIAVRQRVPIRAAYNNYVFEQLSRREEWRG